MYGTLLLMSLLSFFGCGHDTPAPLESIHFSATHGYHAYSNIGYKAERLSNGASRVTVEVGNDRDRVFETDGSLIDTLELIVRQYRMDRFKGHYQPRMEIMDGDSWSTEIKFSDGTHSSCSGYMAYPPGKGAEAIGKTEGILSRWLYQEPAEEIALVSFRYELYNEEGSEAFSFQKKDSIYTVSSRPLGADKPFVSDAGDKDLSRQLANIIRWNHMGSYTGENLAEEDTSRPRWILTAEYENGQRIEAMDYLDRPVGDSWRLGVPSLSEMELRRDTEETFSREMHRIEELEAK